MNTPFIIAELGTAHGGSMQKARELVAAAHESGADCVKLQIVYADEILHPNTGIVPLPGGDVRLYDLFKKLEAPVSFFAELNDYAQSLGLSFLATAFGPKSAADLKQLHPHMVKTASPELNYTPLLEEIAAWRIPVLMSTGVSTLADIDEALRIFEQAETRHLVTILHCVTSYPAPHTEYNLRLITTLNGIFGLPVGISDHSLDPVKVPAVAAALGTAVIEKHFCLSREDAGLDDPIALPPALFKEMTGAVHAAAEMRRQHGEETALSALKKQFGAAEVTAMLGDGVKRLSISEQANYGRTNRSIHALCDIDAGELITKENTAILRTEKILRPGLLPSFWDAVCGRPARTFIPAGEGVRFEDI